jgi:hypothetical protein
MKSNIPNRISNAQCVEEEMKERQEFTENIAKVIHALDAHLTPLFATLPDPRDQSRITYTKESFMWCGIMMFSMLNSSRRQANLFMTAPIVKSNLEAVIPGYAAPHGDTLANWLERIDPEVIQGIYCTLIKKLLRSKEFLNLVGDIKILVDGSGKFSRDWKFSEEALHKKTSGQDDEQTYMSYVLNANMVLENGMAIPLITEFLDNSLQPEFSKQDCEIKAWKRLAPKLRKLFGHKKIIIIADSLYSNEPFSTLCSKYHWEYITSFKNGSMPTVAEEADGLMRAEPTNSLMCHKNGRTQVIQWANGVEKCSSDGHHYSKFNVVKMVESWIDEQPIKGKCPKEINTTYQWLSSYEIHAGNAEDICWDGRNRWLIENCIKTEKHGGYQFEHVFSYDWDTAKAYHYLMNFGHFINIMMLCSEVLLDSIFKLGTSIKRVVEYMRLIFMGSLLIRDSIRAAMAKPFHLRFCTTNYYQCLKT